VTIATYLTLLRIILVPVFVAVLLEPEFMLPEGRVLAVVILVVASLTDALDGYLARLRNEVTRLGKLLDPIADKLLISAGMIAIVQLDLAPAWMIVIILGREFAVSGLRLIAASEGYEIKVSHLGKFKMIAQVFALALLIFSPRTWPAGMFMLWVVMVLAIVSMMSYFQKFWVGMAPERRQQLSKRRTLREIREEVIRTTRTLRELRRQRKLEKRLARREGRIASLRRRLAIARGAAHLPRGLQRTLSSMRRKRPTSETPPRSNGERRPSPMPANGK
jgi:CDP-diacylglycerol--glycerol-3-phosphate 3-phosphatidyltransferase